MRGCFWPARSTGLAPSGSLIRITCTGGSGGTGRGLGLGWSGFRAGSILTLGIGNDLAFVSYLAIIIGMFLLLIDLSAAAQCPRPPAFPGYNL
jgi:hypothetical protein